MLVILHAGVRGGYNPFQKKSIRSFKTVGIRLEESTELLMLVKTWYLLILLVKNTTERI